MHNKIHVDEPESCYYCEFTDFKIETNELTNRIKIKCTSCGNELKVSEPYFFEKGKIYKLNESEIKNVRVMCESGVFSKYLDYKGIKK